MRIKFFSTLIVAATAVTVLQASGFSESTETAANSKAAILPYLELSIPETGQSELRFGNIQPSLIDTTRAGPMSFQIEIKSNIGEQYQVTQIVDGPLINNAGDKIPADQLSFSTYSSKSLGTTITTPVPVTESAPQAIYTSDTQGSNDVIRAEYVLTVPAAQAPGDYASRIIFTVSAL